MSEHIVFMLQLVITGIAVGGVYSLMALGFVLIFKASSGRQLRPGRAGAVRRLRGVGDHPAA